MVKSILPLIMKGVCVTKSKKPILNEVTVEIGATGFTIVLGPNGAGKTTLLRTMHGLERTNAGTLQWQGENNQVRKKQAFVFQTPIVMRRSVVENLAYPLILNGMPKPVAHEQAQTWAKTIGLSKALEQNAGYLSGGEKQKLAIARALISEPEILFLDEPTTNLDGSATREIEEILHKAHVNGTRIIMTTHDIGQARRLATDILFIYRGRLHEFSSATAFFEQSKTPESRAFLNGDIVE
ncbi:MAG: ATP-binding cassette domain-containing protein [Rhizobiaceae bacterium]